MIANVHRGLGPRFEPETAGEQRKSRSAGPGGPKGLTPLVVLEPGSCGGADSTPRRCSGAWPARLSPPGRAVTFRWPAVQNKSGKMSQLLTAIAVLAVIAVVVGLNWFRLQDALKTFYRRK